MSVATRRALYGKMAGDSALNGLLGPAAAGYNKAIYFELAPDDAELPYVVFQKQAGTPRYTFKSGAPAAMNAEVWLVKAVDRGRSADDANAIQDRLDELLTDGTISIAGSEQLYLRRESDIDYSELQDGQRYIHAGSTFRLIYA